MGLLDSLLSAYQSGMGLLNSEPPKKSVMDNYQQPKRYIGPYVNPEEPLSAPTIGPVSLDPTDYIGPNAIAKAGAVVKGLLGSAAAKGLMFAPIGMTAWHGSPHKFDKFDMAKIGTGEGVQAYGHGLYMAESPDVARSYKNSDYSIEYKGNKQRYNNSYGGEDADAALFSKMWRHFGEDENKAHVAMAVLNKQSPNPKEYLQELLTKNAGTKYEYAIRDLLNNASFPSPSMYKVDIPDEAVARFLDWDKPLSQQAPEVQKAIKNFASEYGDFYPGLSDAVQPIEMNSTTGSTLYRLIGGDNPAGGARDLNSLGIPGIRYLDGGSRGAGGGTSNFVLFDDTLPRILERNGVPTGQVPWYPGEWGGLLSQ